ncbi:MAG: porin family protein [Myxococcota bacterium]|nr:porin family protein [Myxococcota bacterium]
MKIGKLLIALTATMLLASSAAAQNNFNYPKPYVQLAGLYAACNLNGFNAPGDCSDNFDSSFGFNFRGGARLNRWFAVEGQVEWVSGFDATSKGIATFNEIDPGLGLTSASVDSVAYTINARLYLTEGRIQPYAIAGIGGQNSWLDTNLGNSDTFTSFIGRFGAGVDLYLTENLALTGEFTYVAATEATARYYDWYNVWTTSSGIDPSYMAVSWGLLYSFY